MLRILFLSAILLSSMTVSLSQPKIWFEDDFNDKSKGWLWSDVDAPEVSRSISNGVYHINHKNKGMIYWTLINIYSHPQKPFLMETNITETESSGENGFGIIIAGREDKYFYFIINPVKKSFWVGSEQKGKWLTYTNPPKDEWGWATSASLEGLNKNNNLKVNYSGDKIQFLINNTAVFTSINTSDF